VSDTHTVWRSAFSWLLPHRSSDGERATAEPEASELGRENADLKRRLHESDTKLRERSERLYDLQQHYSSEHFALQESMRDLKTERMRNSGAYASLETTLDRARGLQKRIAALKERLRRYESVEDEYFDARPILIENSEDKGG